MHAPGPEKSILQRARRSTLPTAIVAALAACLAGNAGAAEDENSCPAPVRASGTARPAPREQSQPGLADTPIGKALSYMNVWEHAQDFGKGIVDSRTIVYFVTSTAVCLFVSVFLLASKKGR